MFLFVIFITSIHYEFYTHFFFHILYFLILLYKHRTNFEWYNFILSFLLFSFSLAFYQKKLNYTMFFYFFTSLHHIVSYYCITINGKDIISIIKYDMKREDVLWSWLWSDLQNTKNRLSWVNLKSVLITYFAVINLSNYTKSFSFRDGVKFNAWSH